MPYHMEAGMMRELVVSRVRPDGRPRARCAARRCSLARCWQTTLCAAAQDRSAPSNPQAMDRGAVQRMDHGAMRGLSTDSTHDGSQPAITRSPDYSVGTGYGPMQGMDMLDNEPMSGVTRSPGAQSSRCDAR